MKKPSKDTVRIALTLVILAIASAIILGVTNMFTMTSENEVFYAKLKKVYAVGVKEELDVSSFSNDKDAQIVRAVVMQDSAIIVISASKKAYSGDGLQLLIIFKENQIVSISPYIQSETPGIGSKVFDKLKGSSDGAVAVTGATKTSTGVRIAVDNAKRFFEEATHAKAS